MATLRQVGCSGTSTDGWTYEVSATTVKQGTDGEVTGTISGSDGSRTIVWTSGVTYKQVDYSLDDEEEDDDENDNETSMTQTSATKTNARALKLALRTSVALEHATQATHVALNSHGPNSSMAATIQQLQRAWEPACKLMNCDHSNYYDLCGASHSHSLALTQAGASARHMRSHVRSRMRLENRMQRFLGEYGVHGASEVYRSEGTHVEQQIQQYTKKGREAMQRHLLGYIATQDAQKTARLLNRVNLQAFFISRGMEAEFKDLFAPQHQDHEDEEEEALLQLAAQDIFGRRRRRRRRGNGGIFGTISQAVSTVAKVVVNVVDDQVKAFVVDLFKCFGQTKTMVVTGYCKKFPLPTSQVGVGVAFTSAVAGSLQSLLQGKFTPRLAVGMSMVVGAVPGSPVTGGVRLGNGIGGNLGCSQTGCSVSIAVGAVTSALIPTNDPACFAGLFILDFRCMTAAGFAITAICCSFDLITGAEDCR